FSGSILGSGLAAASGVTFSTGSVTGVIQPGGTGTGIPVNVSVATSASINALTFTVNTPSGTTNTGSFSVVAPASLASISPDSATAGSDDFTLTIKGTHFNMDSVVNFGAATLAPASISPSQLTVRVPTAAVADVGMLSVSVRTAQIT